MKFLAKFAFLGAIFGSFAWTVYPTQLAWASSSQTRACEKRCHTDCEPDDDPPACERDCNYRCTIGVSRAAGRDGVPPECMAARKNIDTVKRQCRPMPDGSAPTQKDCDDAVRIAKAEFDDCIGLHGIKDAPKSDTSGANPAE